LTEGRHVAQCSGVRRPTLRASNAPLGESRCSAPERDQLRQTC